MLTTRAPAKINLTLHVLGRRSDGYHELESLVAFAGASDVLRFEPGGALSLTTAGATAGEAGPLATNLVIRAARALSERRPGLRVGAFHLVKNLPAAAGIGGGSSDAAAALRLLAQANDIAPTDPVLHQAAAVTGADIPVCLEPQARMMRGAGEQVGPPVVLPSLFAVLVNPRVAVPTAAVFRHLGLQPGTTRRGTGRGTGHPLLEGSGAVPSTADLLSLLTEARNDLEAPALALAPVIGEALGLLRQGADCRLARMSGSGATVFGLYDDCRAAVRASKLLRAVKPEWWIKATLLR